jgi:hypothetical protein
MTARISSTALKRFALAAGMRAAIADSCEGVHGPDLLV